MYDDLSKNPYKKFQMMPGYKLWDRVAQKYGSSKERVAIDDSEIPLNWPETALHIFRTQSPLLLTPLLILSLSSCDKDESKTTKNQFESPQSVEVAGNQLESPPPISTILNGTPKVSPITIEQIASAASKGNAEAQIPTWYKSRINNSRLLASVSHLPQVLQQEKLEELTESIKQQIISAAQEDTALKTLRDIFDKQSTPEIKILERRPGNAQDPTEICFVKVSYPSAESAPITVFERKSGIVSTWIVEFKTDASTGHLYDAHLVPESIEFYPKSPPGDRPAQFDPASPPGTTLKIWGIDMVWCPPGEYLRGSPENEPGRHQFNEDQHLVRLTQGFWISKTEMTQRQWLWYGDLMTNVKSIGPNFPAHGIERAELMRVLDRMNTNAPLPGAFRWTIPTEAQWEYACRAGDQNVSVSDIADIAWHKSNGAANVRPVGLKRPNKWGLHDMIGNLSELCSDEYGAEVEPGIYTHDRAYDQKGVMSTTGHLAFTDPFRRFEGGTTVIRGGGIDSPRSECRPASREASGVYSRNFGVRLVISANNP